MADAHFAATFLLQIAVILLVCRLVGWCAQKVGQPQVVGEMVAGFLMGPSLFAALAPQLQATIFPAETKRVLFVVSQLGLVLYMFCIGLEFRLDVIGGQTRRAAAVSIAGIVVPFALGALLATGLFEAGGFFTVGVSQFQAVLFVGIAMAITAFPMLARIIYERGLAGTELGTLALASGAIDDAVAWIGFAVVLGSFTGSTTLAVSAAVGGLLYVIVVVLGRPILVRMNAVVEAGGGLPPWMLAAMLSALGFGAWFTELVGIYAVFGAFVLGAAVPNGRLSHELQRLIEPITTALLVPLFFVYSGLNSQIALVNSVWLWSVTVVVFFAACLGKGLGCWAAARLTGASRRDAAGIAVLMNCRGMMELILLNIGLQRGLITPTLFTIMVMMAIGTTLMTGPLFALIERRRLTEPPRRQVALGETV
jgi:Kef-type K+ transport system membrane component KefB